MILQADMFIFCSSFIKVSEISIITSYHICARMFWFLGLSHCETGKDRQNVGAKILQVFVFDKSYLTAGKGIKSRMLSKYLHVIVTGLIMFFLMTSFLACETLYIWGSLST